MRSSFASSPLRGEGWGEGTWSPQRQAAFAAALKLLHLIAGISYYKAGVPPKIEVAAGPLDGAMCPLFQTSANHSGEPAPSSLAEVPEDDLAPS